MIADLIAIAATVIYASSGTWATTVSSITGRVDHKLKRAIERLQDTQNR